MFNHYLYKLMEPRVGKIAAKYAEQDQYATLILILATLGGIAIALNVSGLSNGMLWLMYGIILLAILWALYVRIKLARAISEYLNVNVNLFRLPAQYFPIANFDAWLEGIKEQKTKNTNR